MSRKLRPLAALALLAMIGTGCSHVGTGISGSLASTHDKAVKFAERMRANGVSAFPDPDVSGKLTIDVANGSSLDTSIPAFKPAISAYKDLEPPGFTGTKRSPEQQAAALKMIAATAPSTDCSNATNHRHPLADRTRAAGEARGSAVDPTGPVYVPVCTRRACVRR